MLDAITGKAIGASEARGTEMGTANRRPKNEMKAVSELGSLAKDGGAKLERR